MPQHRSAKKRVRQNERKRERNQRKRSMMRTAIKKVRSAPDKETAEKEYRATVSILDHMARKKIIHKNKAANIKSKLFKSVQAE